jgi:hypothetical protein
MNQTYKSVGNIFGNLVEYTDEDAALGSAAQMLTQGQSRSGEEIIVTSVGNVQDKLGSPVTSVVTMNYLNPSTIVSAVPLNNVEVLCSLAFNVNSIPNSAATGAETISLQNVPIATDVVKTAANRDFTPNVSNEVGQMGGGGYSNLNGMEVIKRTEVDKEKGEKAYRSILCAAASAAIKTAPYACAGLDLAATFAPVIGGYLKGNIKGLCESGIDYLAHYVIGRCQMTSKESIRPKNGFTLSDAKGEMVCLAMAAGLKNEKLKLLLHGLEQVIKHHDAFGGGVM